MCGIAGIFDKSSSKSPNELMSLLHRMLSKMQHRGPDDHGEELITTSNQMRLALGHKRLSIIEPGPGGHQPMSNGGSTIWISTNSEIYNYKELKQELEKNHVFKTKSDTEVLLKSYENWGLNCLQKLRGMFAFAILDTTNKRLILARDRMGIKPLYYYTDNKTLIFCSELRPILATKITNNNFSTTGIFQYLSYGRLGSPETIIDSIHELPPGHYLIAEKNRIQIEKYWDPLNNIKSLPQKTSITEQINETLEEAIRLRLMSDVPLGAFLSGGIDSSALAGIMADSTQNSINTISIAFREQLYDESKYSKQIASEIGTQHMK